MRPRYSSTERIAAAPSATAAATPWGERWRTSPAAKTPGRLVSSVYGTRSSGHSGQPAPPRTTAPPVRPDAGVRFRPGRRRRAGPARRGVDVRLPVDEPQDSELPRVASQGQHQRRAIPVLYERSVPRIAEIERPRGITDDDGEPARLRPETRGVIGASEWAIGLSARARSARPEREHHRIVGRFGVPDPHRVDGHDQSHRTRDAGQDLLEVARVGDGPRD